MITILKRDILIAAFIVSIIVFGSSLVLLFALDLSESGRLAFVLLAVASFFTGLSIVLQIKGILRHKKE